MRIEYASFNLRLRALQPISLPVYKGSALRGGFGNAFRKVVCALRRNDCQDCLLKAKCAYAYIFETTPHDGAEALSNYKSIPHPFIIEPPDEPKQEYETGETISFNIVLVGKAIDFLPYFIYSFSELGKMGLGRGRGKFELTDVSTSPEAVSVYSSTSKAIGGYERKVFEFSDEIMMTENTQELTINFLTPARMLYGGRLTSKIDFGTFMRQLLRRLSNLSYFHCNNNKWTIDFRLLIEMANKIVTKENNLIWHDWERYSRRQDARMKMGGVVGSVTYTGNIGAFLPFINAGEILHVGKGTSFGLGKYEIK